MGMKSLLFNDLLFLQVTLDAVSIERETIFEFGLRSIISHSQRNITLQL